MYIIYRGKDYDGDQTYNENCVIGIYDRYNNAHNDLINKLNQLKYGYEIQGQTDDYLYVSCFTKNKKYIT